MKIGNVTLNNNIFLAPMAGITDLSFRIMCRRYGAGLTYTEMVSSKALHYDDKKTMSLIATSDEEKPFAVQIFGSEPKIMASTADKAISTGASIIDINMGCPAPKVANNGDGSALLNNPKLIGDIVKAVVDAVNVPVTCKIRSGFKEVADVEYIAKTIEQNGASAITVHPRTREMYYSGTADRSIIKLVKQSVSIPVIGNGDIFDATSAVDMLEQTGCDGVMVARGAQGNPFIFRQILELLDKGHVDCNPSNEEKIDVMCEHIAMLIEQKGEYIGVREARKHIAWYIKGMKDCAKMRESVCRISSYGELMEKINEYKQIV